VTPSRNPASLVPGLWTISACANLFAFAAIGHSETFPLALLQTPTESSSCLPRLAVGEAVTLLIFLLFLFCPSDLTAPNKSHYSPLCHPACPGVPWERSRGICSAPRLPHKGFRSVSSPTDSSS
jgi:hypothetical protein